PGARIIYAGEEIIGSEQAVMAIRSGKIFIDTGDYFIDYENPLSEKVFWIPVPPVELVIQKDHSAKVLNPHAMPHFYYGSGKGTISLVIKSNFTLEKEEFFYNYGSDSLDLSVNVEDGGILNVDNKRKFKEDPNKPVSLIDRKFDYFDEEFMVDASLHRSISIKGSGKVTFTNPITEKQKEALFLSDVKTTDDGKTWILSEQGGQGAEDQKPEQPKPQPPASSGSTGSQSSVRPDSSSKTDTKRSDDKKAEDKKEQDKKQQDNKIDKATEQTATVAEKVSTKLTIGDKKYTAVIDGVTVEKTMDVAPKIHQGRTVLPARMISELLGVGVRYDAKSKTASFTYGENNKVELTLGQKFMTVNGQKVELSAEVLNENGRILLPLTDIQKAFADLGLKATVGWDAMTRSITIDK
ncbi:MAG: copper amine oxidase N-terminal domain-containing protein, partial [Peptostreptococcaceae bacterium]|nr:copper amine oxidase N-terminal domain-containing protein [Peptostreptococcaceae bacterium]